MPKGKPRRRWRSRCPSPAQCSPHFTKSSTPSTSKAILPLRCTHASTSQLPSPPTPLQGWRPHWHRRRQGVHAVKAVGASMRLSQVAGLLANLAFVEDPAANPWAGSLGPPGTPGNAPAAGSSSSASNIPGGGARLSTTWVGPPLFAARGWRGYQPTLGPWPKRRKRPQGTLPWPPHLTSSSCAPARRPSWASQVALSRSRGLLVAQWPAFLGLCCNHC